jgi:hypothetical protein
MIARAVEPDHGEAGEHDAACLNCGAALNGPYCHACGQKGHVHRTLRGFLHELVHSVFHFDGKLWRTLPLLAWRPGELTRRYAHGERARFVSPIAMFLFSVFLMFAIFSWIGGPFTADASPEDSEAAADFRAEQAQKQAQLTQLRAERQRLAAAGRPTAEIDRRIATLDRTIRIGDDVFRTVSRAKGVEAPRDAPSQKGGAAAQHETAQTKAGEAPELVADFGDSAFAGWLEHGWQKAKENPQLLAYKLQTNAYKFSWALIPISVPFVWLLFLHRRRYRQFHAYDHTVFVTYSIAFMSLGLIALSMLRPIGFPEGLAIVLITFVPPIHMFRQLKGAYQLRWWSALWRTFVLLWFAFIAGTLFFLLLVTAGALG